MAPKPPIGAYPRTPTPTPPPASRYRVTKIRRSPPSSPLPPRPSHQDRLASSTRRWLQEIDGRTMIVRSVPDSTRAHLGSMRKLRRTLRWHHLVQMYDFENFEVKGKYPTRPRYTFWEYCDKGTLADLIYANQHGVEESMVWHTVLSLLKAALYLHHGIKFQDVGRMRWLVNWQPIIHNAIDPNHIFLMSPTNPDDHPKVKLGAWNKVTVLPSREYKTDHNLFRIAPEDKREDTTGFEAPELIWNHGDAETVQDWEEPERRLVPSGARSDVWSIAAVAVAMMGGIARNVAPAFPAFGNKHYIHPWERLQLKSLHRERWHEEELPLQYSSQLRRFLASILVIEPKNRMDTRQALADCMEWRYEWLVQRVGLDEEDDDDHTA